MDVVLSELPLEIQRLLPLSIRTLKTTYDLEELPPREREIIKNYIESVPSVEYKIVYDFKPTISKYADFTTVTDVSELILEYLKNYFYTLPGEYPFDPVFGCRLKLHLHKKDTELRKMLIHTEVNNIVDVLSADLGVSITVLSIDIVPIDMSTHSEYKIIISLMIDDKGPYSIGMQEFSTSDM